MLGGEPEIMNTSHIKASIAKEESTTVQHVYMAEHEEESKRHTAYYACVNKKSAEILVEVLNGNNE